MINGKVRKTRAIELASVGYQPNKAEMKKEYDMPGASREDICQCTSAGERP